MKRIISLLAVCFALTGYSQTNIPPVWSPVLDMLSQTNLIAGSYAMYDTTDKSWGGGLFIGHKLSELVVPIFRLDYVREDAYAVSGNVQLQLPIDVGRSASRPFGVLRITPLAFAGIATSWNNNDSSENGNVIGIFGTGAAITFHGVTQWYIPSGIAFDYERWTGGGFNDNQFRIGPFWKF